MGIGKRKPQSQLSSLEDQAESPKFWPDDMGGASGLPGRVWHGHLYAPGRAFPVARIRPNAKLIGKDEACVPGQHVAVLVHRTPSTQSLQSASGFKACCFKAVPSNLCPGPPRLS